MELEGLFPCSQEPDTGLRPEQGMKKKNLISVT
jgi:hypothetical protein